MISLVIYTILAHGNGVGITFYHRDFDDAGSCEAVKIQMLEQEPFRGRFEDGWSDTILPARRAGRLFCVNMAQKPE